MLGLRMLEGVNLTAFKKDFGIEVQDIFAAVLAGYINKEILFMENGFLRLKPQYMFVANAVLQDFMLI